LSYRGRERDREREERERARERARERESLSPSLPLSLLPSILFPYSLEVHLLSLYWQLIQLIALVQLIF
jgi:hypothetical protein